MLKTTLVRGLCATLLACAAFSAQAQTEYILLSDFEVPTWAETGWKAEGVAFGEGPAEGGIKRQMGVSGFQGTRLVNTYFDGSDRHVGKLTSPEFVIQRDYITFLIGGGGWDGLRLNLLVDGKPVRAATGPNTSPGGKELLSPASFDVKQYKGKKAVLEIVDNETGSWGHILVDQIEQSDTPKGEVVNVPAGNTKTAEAILKRIRNNEKVVVDKNSPDYAKIAAEVEKMTGRENLSLVDQQKAMRELRARYHADPYRPTYHVIPPEGFWNDVNGALFWKGRYHLFFLGREAPSVDDVMSGRDTAKLREVWLHASSADLLHWIWHPVALNFPRDGSMPRGVYSGGAVAGADKPTLIYHVPMQGTCVATSDDDMLVHWTTNPANPVITPTGQHPDVLVFDPAAWKEGDTYYALVGNKTRRAGYEGDTPSLFKSKDLVNWEYLHPFYKSDRKWTHVDEDAACPDFFPIGDNGKYMLVTHVHNPMYGTQYYIGTWKDEVFTPEQHGRMSWPGGSMSGPESLLDGKGRRILWGWLRESRPTIRNGWASFASLPRVLSLDAQNNLHVNPPEELKSLRVDERVKPAQTLAAGKEVLLDTFKGNTTELELVIDPQSASEIRVGVLRSANAEEETVIVYSVKDKTLSFELGKSSLDPTVKYLRYAGGYADARKMTDGERFTDRQVAPFELAKGEPLRLRVFIDRSVVEVFANGRQCVTQRVYPTRADSVGVSVSAQGGDARLLEAKAWNMSPTNSW